MPQQTKIFRVFVSSTFNDMKEERWILQKEVFPELEKFCEERGAKFQGVDLRWGVSENLSKDQKTLQTCFNEIARCQRISPKPNFLILLGDRYGWQPIPEIIPDTEMNAIKNIIACEDKNVIENWYELDENAVPAQHVLKPKELGPNNNWDQTSTGIQGILRSAVEILNFDHTQREKYFDSATHQEINRGALMSPTDAENPKEHVLAFIRKINGLPVGPDALDFIDLVDGKPNEYCKTRLGELKGELSHTLGKNCIGYETKWEGKKSKMSDDYRKEFKEKIINFLTSIIEPLSKSDEIDKERQELDREIKFHKEFENRLTLHFEGRDQIMKSLVDNLENKTEKKTIAVIGVSGSGKSSVMAKAIELTNTQQKGIVFRFIGTTSHSTNIMSLLQSLCMQIANEYGVDAKTLAREGDEKAWYDMNGLSDIFKKCLALATAEKPLIVFLDALDQLSETDNAKSLYWLPKELPSNAIVIISALPELESQLSGTQIMHLPYLEEKDAMEILNKWLEVAKRTLTTEQKQKVIDSFNKTGDSDKKNGLPIYLKLAYEIAKNWHSYDKEYPLKTDVKGIIDNYFEYLENKEFPDEFVKTAICYMLSGRYEGLTETEILEILAFDEDYWKLFLSTSQHAEELEELADHLPKGTMKIPIAVWSRLFLDLEPFLTERDADGVPIITFFHRQFNEVLRKRYMLPDRIFQN